MYIGKQGFIIGRAYICGSKTVSMGAGRTMDWTARLYQLLIIVHDCKWLGGDSGSRDSFLCVSNRKI